MASEFEILGNSFHWLASNGQLEPGKRCNSIFPGQVSGALGNVLDSSESNSDEAQRMTLILTFTVITFVS
jgi:hypothetical protein